MSKKHKHRKRAGQGGNDDLPMTPMIDIVFQLLIYFIVTFEPVDVMAHLDVYAPSPDQKQEKPEENKTMIRIVVFPDGFMINDRAIERDALARILLKLAGYSKDQTVLIKATSLSKHKDLVDVLDLCARAELRNLSVVSTK